MGHGLVGGALGSLAAAGAPPRAHGRVVVLCAALAMAPDLDFVPGIGLGRPALYHQGASHSLAFAAAAGLLGAWALRGSGLSAARAAAVCAAAWASHLALDLFGPDARPPIGIPLLWPFTDATWLSPLTLLPGIHHARATSTGTAEWLGSVASLHNLWAIAIELAVAAPLVALAAVRRAAARPARVT